MKVLLDCGACDHVAWHEIDGPPPEPPLTCLACGRPVSPNHPLEPGFYWHQAAGEAGAHPVELRLVFGYLVVRELGAAEVRRAHELGGGRWVRLEVPVPVT